MQQARFPPVAILAMHSRATTPASNRVCRRWSRWRLRCRWAAAQRNVAIASPNCLYGLRRRLQVGIGTGRLRKFSSRSHIVCSSTLSGHRSAFPLCRWGFSAYQELYLRLLCTGLTCVLRKWRSEVREKVKLLFLVCRFHGVPIRSVNMIKSARIGPANWTERMEWAT